MKVNSRHYPTIIIATFILFLIIAILLGFRPVHGVGTPDEQTTTALINLYGNI